MKFFLRPTATFSDQRVAQLALDGCKRTPGFQKIQSRKHQFADVFEDFAV